MQTGLAQNQDNASEWSHMSICGLLLNLQSIKLNLKFNIKYLFTWILGLGQKPPNNKKYKYKLMFFCFTYIFFLCLCLTVWICKIFFIFYNMIQDFFTSVFQFIFLEHEDIINNWSICLRIMITLIKESNNKNKVVFILKNNNHSI